MPGTLIHLLQLGAGPCWKHSWTVNTNNSSPSATHDQKNGGQRVVPSTWCKAEPDAIRCQPHALDSHSVSSTRDHVAVPVKRVKECAFMQYLFAWMVPSLKRNVKWFYIRH